MHRRDLERIYPGGYEAREAGGLLEGRGRREQGEEHFVGLVGNAPLGAERAWRFADAAWRLADVARLEVFLDCATHAARLEDEKIVLTEFIVDMSFALAQRAAGGERPGLTVLGKAGAACTWRSPLFETPKQAPARATKHSSAQTPKKSKPLSAASSASKPPQPTKTTSFRNPTPPRQWLPFFPTSFRSARKVPVVDLGTGSLCHAANWPSFTRARVVVALGHP